MRGDTQMKVIIDRFEGDYAVIELEDKTICNMPIKLLPEGAIEGSVLELKWIMKRPKIKRGNYKTDGLALGVVLNAKKLFLFFSVFSSEKTLYNCIIQKHRKGNDNGRNSHNSR